MPRDSITFITNDCILIIPGYSTLYVASKLMALPYTSEGPLILGLSLTIINSLKITIVLNDSVNPARSVQIAQAKSQPKDQMQVAILFRLTHIYSPQMLIPYINN